MKGIENEMRLRREVVMIEVRWYFELWSMLKCWLNNEWMCSIELSQHNVRSDVLIETRINTIWSVWNGVCFDLYDLIALGWYVWWLILIGMIGFSDDEW